MILFLDSLASSGYLLYIRYEKTWSINSSSTSWLATWSAIFYIYCACVQNVFIDAHQLLLYWWNTCIVSQNWAKCGSWTTIAGTEYFKAGPKFSCPDNFFQKNWSRGPKFSMKKLVRDQNFRRTKISVTPCWLKLQFVTSTYQECLFAGVMNRKRFRLISYGIFCFNKGLFL